MSGYCYSASQASVQSWTLPVFTVEQNPPWKSVLFRGAIQLPWPGSRSIKDALGLFQMLSCLAAGDVGTGAGPACPYSSAGHYVAAAAFHPSSE